MVRAQGLDRPDLIRFLQVAHPITVRGLSGWRTAHHVATAPFN